MVGFLETNEENTEISRFSGELSGHRWLQPRFCDEAAGELSVSPDHSEAVLGLVLRFGVDPEDGSGFRPRLGSGGHEGRLPASRHRSQQWKREERRLQSFSVQPG